MRPPRRSQRVRTRPSAAYPAPSAPVAHRIEQPPPKRLVASSILAWGTHPPTVGGHGDVPNGGRQFLSLCVGPRIVQRRIGSDQKCRYRMGRRRGEPNILIDLHTRPRLRAECRSGNLRACRLGHSIAADVQSGTKSNAGFCVKLRTSEPSRAMAYTSTLPPRSEVNRMSSSSCAQLDCCPPRDRG